MASTLLLSSYSALAQPLYSQPLLVSQNQQGWNSVLETARLLNANQEVTAIVQQISILDKPATSYANAVYQLFALKNDRWVQVYSNTGARLISSNAGATTLEPEVIPLSELRRQLGDDIDWSSLALKSVVQLRYDLPGGPRDQIVRLEQERNYTAIAQSSTTQIFASRTTQVTMVQTSPAPSSPVVTQTTQTRTTTTQVYRPVTNSVGLPNNEQDPHRGHFGLRILQQNPNLRYVIARVSLQSKRPNGFAKEQFVGDFRYEINQQARFIRGLNPGDRVVIRLFNPQNQIIGYTECELLEDNAVINLILPDRPNDLRVVRTVYGLDRDQNWQIDRDARVYDYFTQLTSGGSDAEALFLQRVENFSLSSFNIVGLPNPMTTSTYPQSFQTGSFLLVNQVVRIFSSELFPTLTATPGQLVQWVNISSRTLSVYEVSQMIIRYREVSITGTNTTGQSQGVEIDDDNDGGKKPRKIRRNCNQGIGNGSEGCDPGNSRPHGGSNDEEGKRPGRNRD